MSSDNKTLTSSMSSNDPRGLNVIFGGKLADIENGDIKAARGSENASSYLDSGKKYISPINKLHVIRLANGLSYNEKEIKGFFTATSATDLCQYNEGAVNYDIEDFLYCKNIGVPINRLITLRRFPVPCMDNIFDVKAPFKDSDEDGSTIKLTETPDIARMVTFMTNDTNKMEDILTIGYALKWKELTADMEQATMFGEQSGVSGFIKKVAAVMDATTNSNYLGGRSTNGPMSSYDPKFDQNRVYGPVDSINSTNIRDVGLEFSKEFEIVFDYELRSINGRTPEAAMKDLIANILAVTYNNGKFWGGSRYWVGERPSPWASKLQWMNTENIDNVMRGMMETMKTTFASIFSGGKQSALNTLKQIVKGGFALALGKIMDGLGRPGIPAMNSLLTADPTGCWHLMIGNPTNPIMSIGNLIITGTDLKFPTDALSYGDFPTKLQVIVKLKPGMPLDKSGVEKIFNHGKTRIYHNPKKVTFTRTNNVYRQHRLINNDFQGEELKRLVGESFDFLEIQNNSIKLPDVSIGNEIQTVSAYHDFSEAKSYETTVVDGDVRVNTNVTNKIDANSEKVKQKEILEKNSK